MFQRSCNPQKIFSKEIVKNLKEDMNEKVLKELRELKPGYKITSSYQIWQESFHSQEIISYEILKQMIEYIHYNPVRKNLVLNPEEWKYSSAVDYYTDRKGLLDIVRIV